MGCISRSVLPGKAASRFACRRSPKRLCQWTCSKTLMRRRGGEQKSECRMWVGGQQRFGGKESKTPEILRSTIEVPSKIHRRSIVTSRLHHAYITLTTRQQHARRRLRAGGACRSRTVGTWGVGGVETLT